MSSINLEYFLPNGNKIIVDKITSITIQSDNQNLCFLPNHTNIITYGKIVKTSGSVSNKIIQNKFGFIYFIANLFTFYEI